MKLDSSQQLETILKEHWEHARSVKSNYFGQPAFMQQLWQVFWDSLQIHTRIIRQISV